MMDRLTLRVLVASLLVGASCLPAVGEALPVGKPAPAIRFETVLHGPADPAKLAEQLAGNVVVLEFWGTWCAPCIQNIPHHNELVEAFADRPVRFVAITDEERRVVEPFLEEQAIGGWVALDTDRSVFESFGIGRLPAAVILGADGDVSAYTDPRTITEEFLNAALEGKPLALPASRGGARQLPNPDSNGDPPLYQVTVRAIPWEQHVDQRGSRSRVSGGQSQLVAEGITLQTALGLAWDLEPTRVRLTFVPEEVVYDLVVYPGDGPAGAWREHLQTALTSALGLSSRLERRSAEVLVLGLIDGKPPELAAGTQPHRSRTANGEIELRYATTGSLCYTLEGLLDRQVIDEAGITTPFDCELRWDNRAPETVFDAVSEQLGFSLRREQREVEVLIVEPR